MTLADELHEQPREDARVTTKTDEEILSEELRIYGSGDPEIISWLLEPAKGGGTYYELTKERSTGWSVHSLNIAVAALEDADQRLFEEVDYPSGDEEADIDASNGFIDSWFEWFVDNLKEHGDEWASWVDVQQQNYSGYLEAIAPAARAKARWLSQESIRKTYSAGAPDATTLTQKDITRRPASLFLPLDKVYSNLNTFNYGARQKVMVNGKNEPELVVDVMLSADDTFDGVATSRTLTTREKYIYRDIMSFWHAGYMQFDAATVWRFSTGQNRKPRPEEVAEYEADIEKYMHTIASIDYSEELRRRNPGIKGGVYREPLLNLGVLTIKRDNGTETKVYRFLSAPILYRHNRETGKQMSSCPRGLIEACAKKRSVTENSYNIRCYLMDRVAHMKRKDKGKGKRPQVSNRIKLETIMDETGMDKTSSSERRNARITIADYLDVFAEQKHIRGWMAVAGKRGIAEAYDIEV